jgi:hypothetical protein
MFLVFSTETTLYAATTLKPFGFLLATRYSDACHSIVESIMTMYAFNALAILAYR